MPARYEVEIDGIVYDIMASGRARACAQAVNAHTRENAKPYVEFLRYVPGAVIYKVETPNGMYEATVRQ